MNLQGSLKSPVSQQLESKAFDTENERLNEDEAKIQNKEANMSDTL